VTVGSVIPDYPGKKVGPFTDALGTSGTGRLARAAQAPWTNDTFTDYHSDNPRIMIVPFCEYLGGNGANASFQVTQFGVWWLETVSNSDVTGRFIKYIMTDVTAAPSSVNTGLWTTQMCD
jgi:hypothetical protein